MTVASRPADSTLAFAALFLGAIAIGASPIFVRLADVGPFASAFWRVALALPLLWVWMVVEPPPKTAQPLKGWAAWRPMIPAGIFFAGDLIFWHLSIQHTTVANATLFANFSPVVVTLGAWLVLKEPITRAFALGLALAMTGSILLVGSSYQLDPAYVRGDMYGIITAFFFGSYVLSVRALRPRVSAAAIMFRSGVITAAILLAVALLMGDPLAPGSLRGWVVLVALAWVSHVGGQGLLAFALGHVTATLSSLVILIEPLAAAILGWLILSEAVTPLQALGGLVILAGISVARRKTKAHPNDMA
jgi:drug/metabolite transporter (DMT)-like permease